MQLCISFDCRLCSYWLYTMYVSVALGFYFEWFLMLLNISSYSLFFMKLGTIHSLVCTSHVALNVNLIYQFNMLVSWLNKQPGRFYIKVTMEIILGPTCNQHRIIIKLILLLCCCYTCTSLYCWVVVSQFQKSQENSITWLRIHRQGLTRSLLSKNYKNTKSRQANSNTARLRHNLAGTKWK